jgi:hypothetical protein
MPALDEEDDPRSVRLEFLLAGEKRFPWDRANRSSFTYVACSKCYVACHPEKLRGKKVMKDKDFSGKARRRKDARGDL